MLRPKITTVFRSRWNALFWSASILVTAYCSVPSPDKTADKAPVAKVADSPAQDRNPWSKDSPAPPARP